jgi:hypothetical protein
MSALGQKRTSPSLDYGVCAGENRRRKVESDSLSSPEIDNQFELGRLFDWKVGRLRPPEDLIDVRRNVSPCLPNIGAVRHQVAIDRKVLPSRHCWNPLLDSKLRYRRALAIDEYAGKREDRRHTVTAKSVEGAIDLADRTHISVL